MSLILRLTKGSALTYTELDGNFTYLNQTISSSVSGTLGTIPVFTASNAIGNSIMQQSGTTITVNGDQTVTGTITAQKLVVQTITSSVVYSSGSNIFGNKLTDTQVLSGSTYLVGSGYLNGVPLTALNGTGFVKANGTNITYDNTAFGTVASVAALTIGTSGTDLTSTVANSTTNPVITLNVPTANATNRGALSAADWTTFNNKQNAITLTTTGTSGAATLVGNTLNIPQYPGTTGTVTSVSGTGTVSGLTLTGTVTTTGNLTLGGSLSLTSGQITTGLGYTPYNSTNPDGYITNKNDTYTGTAKITDIITLTAAEYAAIGSPSSNILYVII